MGTATGRTVWIDLAARSDPGKQRPDNEDSLAIVSLARRSGHHGDFTGEEAVLPGGVLLAVCDGMGGEAGGEVASRRAVESIEATVLGAGPIQAPEALALAVLDSLQVAARDVRAIARARPEIGRMGATATVCGLVGDELVIGQVGDSRAYILRQGRLTQITRDQTLAALLVERGQLLPEEVRGFDCSHVILQALGTSDTVEVDLTSVPVRRGDVLLLCSDGLSGPLDDDVIESVLSGATSAAEASEALIRLANAAGGPDNVTCIVGRLTGDGLAPPDEVAPTARKVCLVPEPAPEHGCDPDIALRETAPETPSADERRGHRASPAETPAPLTARLRALLGLARR